MADKQMSLADLRPASGARKDTKRRGRGNGSGHGTFSGHGTKGSQARSGTKRRVWFEGGQMPLQRRLPNRGFVHEKKVAWQIVNLGDINERTTGDRVDAEALKAAGLIRDAGGPVKVLADGELTRPVVIVAGKFSRAAREKIAVASGKAEEPARA